ncbi:MAG: ATP-dependent DNA ligase [Betaproteobacteria bacterium]|jgi:DNA ligase-1|nr:ATP-dependent DNA ligase [Betaproteobacteria bacterium]MBK7278662.1 ATP-dependent DNA ligase [Betaproteobacteria bacterium]MBK9684671.1 ATP-dependent DNA ligase [Betaproteobacteria bacterium]MBP6317930.1 ATP-dependent DNA ligase [Rubrivivax sp.]
MRRFAQLFQALDASTATGDKVAALVSYLAAAPAADAAWAVYFLAGGKPRQAVPTALLRDLACRQAGIDTWLFDECYQVVGDLAETIAHLLPPAAGTTGAGLAEWIETRLLPLRGLPPAEQADRLAAAWDELDAAGRFLSVKLIGGGFRVGVSRLLVQRAVAEAAALDARLVAQRLVGWTDARATPSAARWQALVSKEAEGAPPAGQPYPFFLAHALQAEPHMLGPRSDWLVEWKYDGIRAQLVKRTGQVWIWSRGEELVTERFPEVVAAAAHLPDGTVLDGELLVWPAQSAVPAAFNLLQQRIGRKTVGKKLLAEAPVAFVAYDLLEAAGLDRREEPQHGRRQRLEALLEPHLQGPAQGLALRLSPLVDAADWLACAALREQSRQRGVEGFMLKHRLSRYGSGRTKADGTWWKWKIAPLTVDAVLVYAQAGHGRRASVYTDYTFAVWSRPPASEAEARAVVEAIARREPAQPGALQLLPFAKAYSGLSDEEFKAVDRVVRAHTLEKFGPVRSVRPTLVFEIGFEGIAASPRHRSGVAVRFPRMLRLRPDKPLHEADSLATLHALMGLSPLQPAGAAENEENGRP